MATLCSSSSLWNGFLRLAKFQFLRLSLWPAPLIHLCRMPSFPATSQFKFQLDLALKPSDLFLSCFLSCTLLIIVISALISSPCFLFPCCLSIYIFPSFVCTFHSLLSVVLYVLPLLWCWLLAMIMVSLPAASKLVTKTQWVVG
jgi:hypothetical protein